MPIEIQAKQIEAEHRAQNRMIVNLPLDLTYRLQALHHWRRGNYSAKLVDIIEAALDLSDSLTSNVGEDEMQAIQTRFLAATSPRKDYLGRSGDEVEF